MKFTVIGMVNGFDFEITAECDTIDDALALTQELKKHGEFLPRPRYSKDNGNKWEPFYGTIEKVEDTKTQTGKDMYIAHVRPDAAEGEQPKELIAVKYMPPKSSWRVGDKVYVDKNEKGWAQLHERAGEPPF